MINKTEMEPKANVMLNASMQITRIVYSELLCAITDLRYWNWF